MKKPSFSFSREWSLKKAVAFRELYRQGARVRGDMVILFYRPAGVEPFRVGFSTRRKLGNAVRRNRARRLMREIFRLHQHEVKPGMEYLFLWTGPGEGVGLKEVEREMVALLKKGGLLR